MAMNRITLCALATSLLLTHAVGQAPDNGTHPEGPFADLHRGSRLIEQGKTAAAERLLRSVVDALPKHAEAWHQLALSRDLQGKHKLALSAVRHAVRLDPKNVNALLMMSKLLVPKDAGYAAELAAKAANYANGNPVAKRKAARLLLAAGRRDRALPIVSELLAKNRNDQELLYLQAELSLALNQPRVAAKAYAALAKLRKHDPWPSESLAGIQILLGKKQEAMASLRASLRIRPSNVGARGKLIRLLEEMKADPKEIAKQRVYHDFYAKVQARRNNTGVAKPGK